METLGKGKAHVLGANHLMAKEITRLLKDKMGIEANIDLGWGGLGIGSKSNTYKEIATGNSLSHEEVLTGIVKMEKYI